MTHDALRPGGDARPDLGFFADPVAGTPVAADLPFGSAARTPHASAPAVTPDPGRISRRSVLLAALVVAALLVGTGVVAVRGWRASSSDAIAGQTKVSTPPRVGDLVRTATAAPTLAALEADLDAAVPLRTPRLATYARGPVTAEVLAVRPVQRLDTAAQARVVTGFSNGVERLTQLPPELAPSLAGSLTGTFGCSQVALGSGESVACVGTSSGAAVVVLVSGLDYAEATHVAAQLRDGVAHRG